MQSASPANIMCNPRKSPDFECAGDTGLLRLASGTLVGSLFGFLIYVFTLASPSVKYTISFSLLGGILFFVIPYLFPSWRKLSGGEWRVIELEIQGIKFVNDATQRRAAWKIFFSMATRIAIRDMQDSEGHNGLALKSLHELFQTCRQAVESIETNFIDNVDSTETYTLDMLNNILAPFLAKWHPKWDSWKKDHEFFECTAWEEHKTFRDELKVIQSTLRERALAFAKIARVPFPERYLNKPSS